MQAALVAAYVVGATTTLGLLVEQPHRDPTGVLADLLAGRAAALIVGAALVVAGLVALVGRLLGRYTVTARRLAAETRLLLEANPAHRVDAPGPPELVELGAAVNDWPSDVASPRTRSPHRSPTPGRVGAGAEPPGDVDGRARRRGGGLQRRRPDPALQLRRPRGAGRRGGRRIGRSIFGIVDRELLQHALARIEASADSSHVATTLHRDRVLQVRVAPVSGPDHEWTGFMLLLEDLTERMGASARRNDLLQEFTGGDPRVPGQHPRGDRDRRAIPRWTPRSGSSSSASSATSPNGSAAGRGVGRGVSRLRGGLAVQ